MLLECATRALHAVSRVIINGEATAAANQLEVRLVKRVPPKVTTDLRDLLIEGWVRSHYVVREHLNLFNHGLCLGNVVAFVDIVPCLNSPDNLHSIRRGSRIGYIAANAGLAHEGHVVANGLQAHVGRSVQKCLGKRGHEVRVQFLEGAARQTHVEGEAALEVGGRRKARACGQLVESVLLLEVEAVSLGAVADHVAPGQQGKRLCVHHVVSEAREAARDEPLAPLALDVAVRGGPQRQTLRLPELLDLPRVHNIGTLRFCLGFIVSSRTGDVVRAGPKQSGRVAGDQGDAA